MDELSRKKIVIKLLNNAHSKAIEEARILRSESSPTLDFVEEHLRKYILSKFLLPENCNENNITVLAELSLAHSLSLDRKLIKELDTAAPCDNVSSASAKKVLLFYSLCKDIDVHPDVSLLVSQKTISSLSKVVLASLRQISTC